MGRTNLRAQTQNLHNVIDLTGTDDDGDMLESLSVAASKAAHAASCLSYQFSLLTSAPNHWRDSHDDLTRQSTHFKSAADESSRAWDKNRLPQTSSRIAGDAHDLNSGTMLRQADGKRSFDETKIPKPSSPLMISNAPALRSPRAAARSAGRSISQQLDILNPLEAQEAKTTTPKKPGRPRLDQWTPKWRPKGAAQSLGKEHDQIRQRASPDGKHELISDKPMTRESFELAVAKKRKRSSPSPDSDRPTRSSKRIVVDSKQPSGYSKIYTTVNPESEGSEQPLQSREVLPEVSISSGSGSGNSRANGTLSSTEFSKKLESMGYFNDFAFDPAESTALVTVFTTTVYPALKKAEKRAKDRFTEEQLQLISRSVSQSTVYFVLPHRTVLKWKRWQQTS